ncbi:MAG: hypothetical protein DI629_12100 [Mesorhizobium amorphae]|nr:MAG: hypothetical protein DI629_12100 [Mesorhizobium amorphae]
MSDDSKFPSQLAERFQIRMPDGLRDRLREAAAESGRSMNSEIVERLQSSFDAGDKALDLLDKSVNGIEELLKQSERDKAMADWMLSQMRIMRYLLESVIAAGDRLPETLRRTIWMLTDQALHPKKFDDEKLYDLLVQHMDDAEALKDVDPSYRVHTQPDEAEGTDPQLSPIYGRPTFDASDGPPDDLNPPNKKGRLVRLGEEPRSKPGKLKKGS